MIDEKTGFPDGRVEVSTLLEQTKGGRDAEQQCLNGRTLEESNVDIVSIDEIRCRPSDDVSSKAIKRNRVRVQLPLLLSRM